MRDGNESYSRACAQLQAPDSVLLIESNPSTPLFFLLEQAGVCPLALITKFTSTVSTARQWWEKGELGYGYIQAPEWVPRAFGIFSEAMMNAVDYKRDMER